MERKLNRKLIKKVIKRIETMPESYAQQDYKADAEEFNADVRCGGGGTKRPIPVCGTVACIAGEALICAKPALQQGLSSLHRTHYHNVGDRARQLLGLSNHQADILFAGDPENRWPEPFQSQYSNATTYRGQAGAAVRLLKAILRTDGKILGQ